MTDPVNHPAHYTEHPSGIECIQITEHMGFNLGNAVKYIWRADLKGSAIEDLEKARWYIDRELAKRGEATEAAEEETKAEELQDVEVMQWDGTRKSIQAICDWVNSFDDELDDPTITYSFSSAAPDGVLDVSLTTNEDYVQVSVGDFIIRGTQGNFYRRDCNAYATVAASSPVVPAPTETEWATVVEIPVGAAFRPAGYTGPSYIIKTALGYRITPNGDHRLWNGAPVGTLAPFVAAEEG